MGTGDTNVTSDVCRSPCRTQSRSGNMHFSDVSGSEGGREREEGEGGGEAGKGKERGGGCERWVLTTQMSRQTSLGQPAARRAGQGTRTSQR